MRLAVKPACIAAARDAPYSLSAAVRDRIAFNSVQVPRAMNVDENANGRTPILKGSKCLARLACLLTAPAKMRRLDIGGLGFDRQPS